MKGLWMLQKVCLLQKVHEKRILKNKSIYGQTKIGMGLFNLKYADTE